MYKRVVLFVFIFLTGLGFYVFAQEEDLGIERASGEETLHYAIIRHRVSLARTSPDYRVTPGDVYTLVYSVPSPVHGINFISYTIVVDVAYNIRVANMGVINGAGRTFAQVRTDVEALVTRHHPLSGPQLRLTQPANFRVFVSGEVYRTAEPSAWGLSRLCSLIDENVTRFASIRDISVMSRGGEPRVYDLFQFQRFGDESQNPFLRPGDVIVFNRVSRFVTIEGAVERPGTYQLLDGENINELIQLYGHGFMPRADSTRVEVVRHINSEDFSGDRLFLTGDDLENNFVLENYDVVIVPTVTQVKPVVFIEGAVNIDEAVNSMGVAVAAGTGIVAANRITMQFNVGETYAALVRRNAGWFSSVSDTQNAHIVRRGGEHIPINLDNALFDSSYRGEVLVQDGDMLVVPFRQFFVTVAGAVVNPGRFPFSPGRELEHYIGLAGGFVPTRNLSGSVVLTDRNGRRLRAGDPITPETVITARSNHPLFFFNQIAPVITATVSVLTLILVTR